MTDHPELVDLIAEATARGAKVKVETDDIGFPTRITVTGLKGVGPHPMASVGTVDVGQRLVTAYCPADRFRSRQQLADHEHEHRRAELATRPADPLMVLREALVWAIDEDALRLIPAEFHPLFEPARLRPVKSPPGFVASLVGKHDGVEVRARLTTGGLEMHLQVDVPPRLSQRTRVRLPAEFAIRSTEVLTREAA